MKIKTFDLTGFGGGYESTCQRMVWNGVRFLVANKMELAPVYKEYQNVYGLAISEGQDAEDLDKAIMAGIKGATGAMHQCAVGHIRHIAKNGYAKWFEMMKEAREKDGDKETEFEYDKEFVLP